MFIRRKKLIALLKKWQLDIRQSNQICKQQFIKEKKNQQAGDMQLYEDGNDNAFNYIISKLNK